jgi:hypothetical protein
MSCSNPGYGSLRIDRLSRLFAFPSDFNPTQLKEHGYEHECQGHPERKRRASSPADAYAATGRGENGTTQGKSCADAEEKRGFVALSSITNTIRDASTKTWARDVEKT